MLSQKTKYALRALLMLAEVGEGQMVQVADIAERQKVPKKFLELILLELKKHGLLHSRRGKNGGYALGKPASEIFFGHIIRIMDGPIAPLPCASLTGYRKCSDCPDEATCPIRRIMRRVRDAMSEILDKTSIADALTPRGQKARNLARLPAARGRRARALPA